MDKKYYYILTIILLIGIIFAIVYIPKQKEINKTGFLKGKININPLCPVETSPPQSECQPTAETYKSRQIIIWNINKNKIISKINPNLNGNYKLELPTGEYLLDFEKQQQFNKELPKKITIKNNKITIFNINIDTGIR